MALCTMVTIGINASINVTLNHSIQYSMQATQCYYRSANSTWHDGTYEFKSFYMLSTPGSYYNNMATSCMLKVSYANNYIMSAL